MALNAEQLQAKIRDFGIFFRNFRTVNQLTAEDLNTVTERFEELKDYANKKSAIFRLAIISGHVSIVDKFFEVLHNNPNANRYVDFIIQNITSKIDEASLPILQSLESRINNYYTNEMLCRMLETEFNSVNEEKVLYILEKLSPAPALNSMNNSLNQMITQNNSMTLMSGLQTRCEKFTEAANFIGRIKNEWFAVYNQLSEQMHLNGQSVKALSKLVLDYLPKTQIFVRNPATLNTDLQTIDNAIAQLRQNIAQIKTSHSQYFDERNNRTPPSRGRTMTTNYDAQRSMSSTSAAASASGPSTTAAVLLPDPRAFPSLTVPTQSGGAANSSATSSNSTRARTRNEEGSNKRQRIG